MAGGTACRSIDSRSRDADRSTASAGEAEIQAETTRASSVATTTDSSHTLDELIAAAQSLIVPGERHFLGVTGAPGSGKSTLAEARATALGADAVLVAMDGFHLANAELKRLNRHARKGAPDTFDAAGYVNLLRRLHERDEPVV